MNDLLTRRAVVAGMGVLGLGLLAGCNPARSLDFKYGKNMSNEILGRSFRLKDTQGNVRTLSSFYGSMPMIFFGFTQCPAVCPTTLARAAQIKKLMGRDAGFLQVVFITLDPERDTPEVLDAYVKAFDPSFTALTGTLRKSPRWPGSSRCSTRRCQRAIPTPSPTRPPATSMIRAVPCA